MRGERSMKDLMRILCALVLSVAIMPVEMITLYYLDGDQIKLTHYCMAGNQPTMRGTYAPETKTLKFALESITNLKSADSGHMHHATYTFIDNDHFKTTWTFRKDQKDSFTEDVTYVRTK